MRQAGPRTEINFIPWTSQIRFEDFDLVVNTTPGNTASVFCEQITSAQATLFEVLYNPWPTQLLSHWRNSGGYGIDGLDLLIHQAISQVELFADVSIERSDMAKALRIEGERALS
jgi:shikimate dehydrogenase